MHHLDGNLPAPQPPLWALEAGLPGPRDGEGFRAYCARIGLDCDALVEGLDGRTACIAALRLNSEIMRRAPDAFDAHVRLLFERFVGGGRREEVERIRHAVMPAGYRR